MSKKIYKNKKIWDDKLLYLSVYFIVAILLILLGFSTFDYYNHLFFARHYKNNWFSLIDYQQAGGLDLSSYPPLAHQILALFSFILPFGVSYNIILLIFWVLLSYFAAKFFSEYLETNLWLNFSLIFLSLGILKTIFVFGQFTTIVGFAFGFISLYFFYKSLKESKLEYFILFCLSLALTAFSHIFSFLIFIFFYIIFSIAEWRLVKKNYKILSLSIVASTIIITLGLSLLITEIFYQTLIPEKEIQHFSRTPLVSLVEFKRHIILTYGLSFAMIISPILLFLLDGLDRKKFLTLYLIAIFFFLIGIGRTTPLPKILLGNLEYWLTYDRFSLMASIIFIPLIAYFISKIKFSSKIFSFLYVFMLIYLMLNLQWLITAHNSFTGSNINNNSQNKDKIRNYVINFLNSEGNHYRYQTFGYGRTIGEIYFYTNMSTLDTEYFSGRRMDWLRNSGMEVIDQVKDENSLNTFFAHASNNSVKYIITFSDFYHDYLKERGWNILENKTFNEYKVIIWSNPEPAIEVQNEKENITIFNYLWGILPLLTLVSFILLLLKFELRIKFEAVKK